MMQNNSYVVEIYPLVLPRQIMFRRNCKDEYEADKCVDFFKQLGHCHIQKRKLIKRHTEEDEMFMTPQQLDASIRNKQKDSAFWSNTEKVAKYERELKEYEEFCQKYGYP